MNMLFIKTDILPIAAATPAKVEGLSSSELQNYVGYGAIIFMMVLFLIAFLVMLRAFNTMSKLLLNPDAFPKTETEDKPKQSIWLKLASLRPMAEEKDLLIDHDYDGIQELDNPTPAWFMWLFYITIAFGIGYLGIYHVFGIGQLQDEEYKTEVAQADSAKKVYLATVGNQVDETTVKLVTDAAVIESGKGIFTQNCAACHGAEGQGVVGPNLTDDYWLHGGNIGDVFKTIKYGVAAKGMPTWEKQLSPKQISDVANFIKSIHGTNPANPKAPQGDKEAGTEEKTEAK